MTEKFLVSLEKAEKSIRLADHFLNVTFPLVKEYRLLLKIISELYVGVINLINASLQYDYYHKRITIFQDSQTNLRTFKESCALRNGLSDNEVSTLLEVIRLFKVHKSSSMEFVKDDKVVLMSDSLKPEILSLLKVKSLVSTIKLVLLKIMTKTK